MTDSTKISERSLEKATRGLVRDFRLQRPLRSGSLLITIMGDAVAPRGGRIALSSLIQLAQPFGFAERLVRTSTNRLAGDAWLECKRVGRQSFYGLTAMGRIRFAAATERIYAGALPHWEGMWTLIVCNPLPGDVRDKVRKELSLMGFGQLTPEVFAHPTRGMDHARELLSEYDLLEHVILISAKTLPPSLDSQIVRSGWDLASLAERYSLFADRFERLLTICSAKRNIDPESAFVIRTLLIHEYRKIQLRDPMLPESLLPDSWIGATARTVCGALYRTVFEPAERFLSQLGRTEHGAMPPSDSEARKRFDGF